MPWSSILTSGAILIFTFNFTYASEKCKISESEIAHYMKMDYKSFDQNPFGGGWRKYGNSGCYQAAALLLDRYYKHHSELDESQKIIITFHAGQMFAFDDNYPFAISRFESSFNKNEPANTPILWNAYVSATIFFLKKDKVNLLEERQKIAEGPIFQGKKANLDIVDRLVKYFDQSYAFAYGGH